MPNSLLVTLYSSPAHIPFCIAGHLWFVVKNGKNQIRYEVLWHQNKENGTHIYLHHTRLTDGLGIFPFLEHPIWSSRKEKTFTSDESLRIYEALKKSDYPYASKYRLLGPNSNTYVAWILLQSGVETELPWNAIGKDFMRK